MSFLYSIDPSEKLAYITLPENIDLQASLEGMRALATDERLGQDFGILVDLRALKAIPSIQEARQIASMGSQRALFLGHPTALVVSQVVQYGMGNMISILAGLQGAIVQPFYEVEEAKTWLRRHLNRTGAAGTKLA